MRYWPLASVLPSFTEWSRFRVHLMVAPAIGLPFSVTSLPLRIPVFCWPAPIATARQTIRHREETSLFINWLLVGLEPFLFPDTGNVNSSAGERRWLVPYIIAALEGP